MTGAPAIKRREAPALGDVRGAGDKAATSGGEINHSTVSVGSGGGGGSSGRSGAVREEEMRVTSAAVTALKAGNGVSGGAKKQSGK